MSPSMSKTIVFPSGEMSTSDQVVSVVSIETGVHVPGGLATSHFFSSFLSLSSLPASFEAASFDASPFAGFADLPASAPADLPASAPVDVPAAAAGRGRQDRRRGRV